MKGVRWYDIMINNQLVRRQEATDQIMFSALPFKGSNQAPCRQCYGPLQVLR